MSYLLFCKAMPMTHNSLWYAVPAVITISLVYAATRHEQMRPILIHAGRVAVWILGFMFMIFAVLEALNLMT